MPGSLFHALSFEKRPYTGADGLDHWEVEPVHGDADVVSRGSWNELVSHCARLGVPEDVWPTFACDSAIDVPLDEVAAKQAALREALRGLSPAQRSGHALLRRVLAYLDRGEAVFFTE